MLFHDRQDAGRQLAEKLNHIDVKNAVVLALPRGGVPLGLEIARTHQLDFDVLLSKKIGHPYQPEYAIGAVSESGDPLLNRMETDRIEGDWLEREVNILRKQMTNRRQMYAKWLESKPVKGRPVIIVDDGIATGLTMKAAINAVINQGAEKIIIAVPVIPMDTYRTLKKAVDQVVAVEVPDHFLGAVGAYYNHFLQVEDKEVQRLLKSLKGK